MPNNDVPPFWVIVSLVQGIGSGSYIVTRPLPEIVIKGPFFFSRHEFNFRIIRPCKATSMLPCAHFSVSSLRC